MAVDWQTVSSLATGAGTLVLAVATFGSVRSGNRSARVAERALLAGMRPLLVQSLAGDPTHKALWSDRHTARIEGGRAVAESEGEVVYLAIGLRNVGSGIAVLHAWYPRTGIFGENSHAAPEEFRALTIDLYVPPGGTGYWESAIRSADDPALPAFTTALAEREPFAVDLLYGDQDGGQRTISRFVVLPAGDGGWYAQAARHWGVDRPAPRPS
ncbi:MAG TPA: hypothetical protein VFJ85_04705 [Acidimicrobiales bacterium]|nr:hypothetical protein [Acidimicrobiales bacterium]